MASINLNQVSVQMPVYSNHSRSMKSSFLKRLTKDKAQINSVTALNNLDLHLKDGDRLGVMGPNGSGKSTLLRTIAGIYEPTLGSIEVKGVSHLLSISHSAWIWRPRVMKIFVYAAS